MSFSGYVKISRSETLRQRRFSSANITHYPHIHNIIYIKNAEKHIFGDFLEDFMLTLQWLTF